MFNKPLSRQPQPAVANYVRNLGTGGMLPNLSHDMEIVTFVPDTFPLFGLPILMDPAPEMNMRH